MSVKLTREQEKHNRDSHYNQDNSRLPSSQGCIEAATPLPVSVLKAAFEATELKRRLTAELPAKSNREIVVQRVHDYIASYD